MGKYCCVMYGVKLLIIDKLEPQISQGNYVVFMFLFKLHLEKDLQVVVKVIVNSKYNNNNDKRCTILF